MTARLGAFSWRWATVRKIKLCLTVSALCSSPRASGYPAPTQAPGIPPIAALASHGARLQVTSSSNLPSPRRWAHQARSLGPSLPSTSLDRLSRPASIPSPGLSRVSPLPRTPFTFPPRSPLPARPDPPQPLARPVRILPAARLALFPLALFSARLGFLTICFRFHGSIVGIR
jgi:hypothetical protein